MTRRVTFALLTITLTTFAGAVLTEVIFRVLEHREVYDAVWGLTFAGNPRYSRTAASDRVRAFCQSHGIAYVDTLDALHARASLTGRPLHFPQDGHANALGRDAIAETVFTSGLLPPVR